jgi:hypothetical protein
VKDFGRWFSDFKLPVAQPIESMLPDGVSERGVGRYEARCVSCERYTEILCDLGEIPEVGYRHYCFGSDRCCP